MGKDETSWGRYRIEPIGLSVDTYLPWKIETLTERNWAEVYQRTGDGDGVVFVSYGAGQTIDDFVSGLGDLVTQATVTDDLAVDYHGIRARRVTARTVKGPLGVYRVDGEKIEHGESPEVRSANLAIGFSHRGIPILVGYRVPEESLPPIRGILDRIVNSVTVDRP